jgi:hypothetical protein
MKHETKTSGTKKARPQENRPAEDPFGYLLEQVLEALGAASGGFDAGFLRRAAESGEAVVRRGTEVMEAFAGWLESGSQGAPEPEASVRLQRAAGDFFNSLIGETAGRYLGLPPLGPAREAQIKAQQALDAYQRLTVSLVEFSNDFSLPFCETLGWVRGMAAEPGREIESADDLYQVLRAAVDENYQAYLGSPRGVRRVAGIVEDYLEFRMRTDAALAPLFRFLGLPAKEDMDAVYLRLHRLQKRNRDLQTALEQQAAAVEKLQRQVRRLEAAAGKLKTAAQPEKTAADGRKSRARRRAPAADAEQG